MEICRKKTYTTLARKIRPFDILVCILLQLCRKKYQIYNEKFSFHFSFNHSKNDKISIGYQEKSKKVYKRK